MKIYFAGSIRGGRDDIAIYAEIISYLNKYGDVLTEHIGKKSLSDMGEQNLRDEQIHDRDMKWVLEADVLVAEVTTPSLGVGYEIGRAVENDKKILCLYRPLDGKRLSAMIKGDSNIVNVEYRGIEEAFVAIDEFFK